MDNKSILLIGEKADKTLVYHDLTKHPVILMTGATCSGKSNMIHSFICSLSQRFNSQDLALALIDCKLVEFDYLYKNIPNLFAPISHCGKSDFRIFKKLDKEIERRKSLSIKKPYIFIAIDEFSDLACQFPSELENLVEKISKYGSGVGIGLSMHTSRPGRDIITKKIDQIIQTRICFATASREDSILVTGREGAEKLSNPGECLYLITKKSEPIHLQTPLITDKEIKQISQKEK